MRELPRLRFTFTYAMAADNLTRMPKLATA